MMEYRLEYWSSGDFTAAALVRKDADGHVYCADPIVFRERKEGSKESDIFVEFNHKEEKFGGDLFRAIFNALWDKGMRPDVPAHQTRLP